MEDGKLMNFNEREDEMPKKDRVLKSSASELRLKS